MASFKKISTTIALIIILVLPPPQRYHSKSHLCVGQWTMYLPSRSHFLGKIPRARSHFLMNGWMDVCPHLQLTHCLHVIIINYFITQRKKSTEQRRQCCFSNHWSTGYKDNILFVFVSNWDNPCYCTIGCTRITWLASHYIFACEYINETILLTAIN